MRQQSLKRAAATGISAIAGFGAVLGAHVARSSPRAAVGTPVGNAAATKTPATTSPATKSPGTKSADTGPPSGNTPSSTQKQANPAGTTPSTQSTAQSSQQTSALGATEQYGYGELSVRVTMQGNRITDVSLANLQTAESYSQMIAQQAIPILRQEVLQAQGVQVNGISGATYTSEAYLLSVQSALQKLHA
jgi:uncharacterized protein with FMN-binding domain